MRVLPYCSHALADIATLMNGRPAERRSSSVQAVMRAGFVRMEYVLRQHHVKNAIYRVTRSTPDWTHLYHRAIPLYVRKSDYGREAA